MSRAMMFSDGRTEYSFWGNVDFKTDAAAKQARDAKARELRQTGQTVRRWVLRNQVRPYAGLGQPDGTSGHVYKITASPA